MLNQQPLTCILIGETSLLLRCAELLVARNYCVLAVVSDDAGTQIDCPVFSTLAEAMQRIEQRPDLLFSIANRSILSPAEVSFARLAAVNYHDSLLPAYAGVNAPSWAILRGETSHGISWHRIASSIDAGHILVQREFAIDADESALSLSIKCVHHALEGFLELLVLIEAGDLGGTPQNLSRRSYFSRSRRLPRQGILRWSDDAVSICRFVRSAQLGPYANDFGLPKVLCPDGTLLIVGEVAVDGRIVHQPCGTVVDSTHGSISVVAGDGLILRLGSLLTLHGGDFVGASSLVGLRLGCLDPFQESLIAQATAAAAEQEDAVRACMSDLPAPFHLVPLRPFKFPSSGERTFHRPIDGKHSFGQVMAEVLQRLLVDQGSTPVLLGLYQECPCGFMAIRPLICRSAPQRELAILIEIELASPAIPADLPARFPELSGSQLRLRSLSVCLSAEPDPPIANPGLLICWSAGMLSLRFDATQIDEADAARLAAYLLGTSELLPPRGREDADPWRSVPRQIADQTRLTPDAIALEYGSQRLTYAEVDRRVTLLASRLLTHGAGCERRYALLLPQGIDFPIAALAVLRAGAAYIPLDLSAPLHQLNRILQDACPLAILTLAPSQPLAEQLACPVIYLDVYLTAGMPEVETDIAPDDLAYVMYTSGSTGAPKGCMIEHRSLSWFVEQSVSRHGIGPGDRLLQLCAVSFDASVEEIFTAFCAGATLVVRPPSLLDSAETYLDFCERAGLTIVGLYVSLIPAVLRVMEQRGRFPPTVRILTTGGEIVPAASVERWRRFFVDAAIPPPLLFNVYGLTETTVANLLADLSSASDLSAGVPIGSPLPGTRFRVVADNLSAAPPGDVGELLLSGPQLARGYWSRPELTALRFEWDPCDGTRWFRTGDLVRIAPCGALIVVGRSDRQVQLNGIRVELEGIERELLAHPNVVQAVVVLDKETGPMPLVVAYWVPQPAHSLPPSALRQFLSDRLPAHALPAAFVALPSIPLTTNGKPDLRSLPSPWSSRQTGKPSFSPAETHHKLRRLWSEVLGHSDFGPNDHFVMVGGDSLAAARLSSLFERQFHLQIPVIEIFRSPTICEQAQWLASHTSPVPAMEQPGNLLTLQPHGNLPPLFVVHGWGGSVGGFSSLARAFAPDRPVLGLQASVTDSMPCPPSSVEELAGEYAEQILASQPDGPIHLLGYSAGGWYAHAVASALLSRGASLGLFAVLDTQVGARIHRRLRLELLVRTALPRMLPRLRGLIAPPTGQSRRRYLLERGRGVNRLLHQHLRVRVPSPRRFVLARVGKPSPLQDDDLFVRLSWDGYRPLRLPLVVDLFAPEANLFQLRRLWRFYGKHGVRCHPIFRDHHDFRRPELMAELAETLKTALRQNEM
jgi:amino acid adenylation domain-containing protein